MTEELKRIEKLEKLLADNGIFEDKNQIPTFSFSTIKESELISLVDIKLKIDESKFSELFNNNIEIDKSTIEFLEILIERTKPLIKYYKEEDLKLHFLEYIFYLKISSKKLKYLKN
jgi:hypothetical protein